MKLPTVAEVKEKPWLKARLPLSEWEQKIVQARLQEKMDDLPRTWK